MISVSSGLRNSPGCRPDRQPLRDLLERAEGARGCRKIRPGGRVTLILGRDHRVTTELDRFPIDSFFRGTCTGA